MNGCDVVELKKAMAEKGIDTITMLSAKTNISRTTLGRVLKGKIRPSTSVIHKMADVLELDSNKVGHIFFDNNLRNT
jgi:predicted transcriptional regulator